MKNTQQDVRSIFGDDGVAHKNRECGGVKNWDRENYRSAEIYINVLYIVIYIYIYNGPNVTHSNVATS